MDIFTAERDLILANICMFQTDAQTNNSADTLYSV